MISYLSKFVLVFAIIPSRAFAGGVESVAALVAAVKDGAEGATI
jgi:hypothetical protein